MKKHTLHQIKAAVANPTLQKANLTIPTSPTLLSKITDFKVLESLGILLVQASDLREITTNSGPLTTSNEYQIHYWFLNGRFTFAPGIYIDIAIPTVYFNYEQQVSGAAVDFELEAVDKMSEALLPVHNTKVNEIMENKVITEALSTLGTTLTQKMGSNKFEWIGVNLGTIHKHPGSLSTFSGTDLSTSVTSPGICYPFGPLGEKDITDKPSFSSIMLHKGSDTVIGRTEYRTATSPKSDHVQYKKHRCLTLIHDTPTTPGLLDSFLGTKPESTDYIKADYITQEQLDAMNIHTLLLDVLKDSNYTANTAFIDSKNVSKIKLPVSKGWPTSKIAKTVTPAGTIPHRNSAEWRMVANEVEDYYGVKLQPFSIIISKTKKERLSHFKDLYESVYETKPTISEEELTPMDIVNLQDRIWLETQKDMTVLQKSESDSIESMLDRIWEDPEEELEDIVTTEEMCHDLKTFGVSQTIIDNLTPTQIAGAWKDAQKP